jgi:hypothetical protein
MRICGPLSRENAFLTGSSQCQLLQWPLTNGYVLMKGIGHVPS